MRSDIIDLKVFYSRPLGEIVERVVNRHLLAMWPNVQDETLLGIGYASPFLDQFRHKARRLINLMPAQQGVSRWPILNPNATALVDDCVLPLADSSIDRALLVHGLETAENVRPLLREIWRVLAPSGRLLVIAPNRRGLWARVETTPFGQGRPYSRGQLMQLMRDHQLVPQDWREALFMPPVQLAFFLKTAAVWERFGPRIWPRFPGLYMVEVSKQIYAMTGERKRARVLRPVPVAQPGLVGNMREGEID